MNSLVYALFRRISPCARFVGEGREVSVKTVHAVFERLPRIVNKVKRNNSVLEKCSDK